MAHDETASAGRGHTLLRGALLAAAFTAAVAGCGPAAGVLGPGPQDGGVAVRWDLLAQPLPEIPMPNDVATRLDPTSPTGRRVNISMLAPTALERDLRAKAGNLAGFGIFMPITIPFDGPIDVGEVLARQRDNEDPSDDVLYLVDIDPHSPHFGERVPLDVGAGYFPVVHEEPDKYFDNDPMADVMNILYPTYQEDTNCNGALDPGEDLDGDGVLDRPNTYGLEWEEDANCNGVLDPGEDFDCDGVLDHNPDLFGGVHEDWNCNGVLDPGEDLDCDGQLDVNTGLIEPAAGDTNGNFVIDDGEQWDCAATLAPLHEELRARRDAALTDHLVTFFEYQTNTLIARPILPLRQYTRYAVVVTRRLLGADGRPVRSPWPDRAPASQAAALAPLPLVLSHLGLSLDDVAFTWVFTTGQATEDLEAIRRGLYGHGPLARLGSEFGLDSLELARLQDDPGAKNPYIATHDQVAAPLDLLGTATGEFGSIIDFDYVSHVVVGSFDSPNFLVDRDGLATEDYPQDDDEIFDVDPRTGRATYGHTRVTFWCFIPKEIPGVQEQPFPVQMYGHGYTSSKFELIAMVGRMARFGIASCAIDAFGHGLRWIRQRTMDGPNGPIPVVDFAKNLLEPYGVASFVDAIIDGRDRDLNNDGVPDSGGDFWTFDTFHTRDIVRQSVVDWMEFIRLLRSFDGEQLMAADTDGDGQPNLAGDFDGDGVPDLGGPSAHYSAWGESLGGILSGILAGIEPALDAAAPTAGGAGLLDVAVRSRQGGVPEAVFMPMLGPFVVGDPAADGKGVDLRFLLSDVNRRDSRVFATGVDVRPGDRVVLRNLRSGEYHQVWVPASRRFRVAVAADALTATEKRHLLGLDTPATANPGAVPDGSGERTPPTRADATTTPRANVPAGPVAVGDPRTFGDPLVVEVYRPGASEPSVVVDSFAQDVEWQGALYPEGTPLVALQKGFGFTRNTPDFRRFIGIASMILQSGDPVAYAPHFWREPLPTTDYDDASPGSNVLVIPTVGDQNVPVNTGIEMAIAAGIVPIESPDPRYGKSAGRLIVDTYTNEGVERLWRYEVDVDQDTDGDCVPDGAPVKRMGLFDIDDLDEGLSEFHAPSPDEPLRATVRSADGKAPATTPECSPDGATCGTVWADANGIAAMRIPYESYKGRHGFGEPDSCRKFDIDRYMLNLVGQYFASGGTFLPDHVCLASDNCPFFPPTFFDAVAP